MRFERTDAPNYFHSDERFDELYPLPVAVLAEQHWTPLAVSRKAAAFLAVEDKSRILDIGSGVGKFCLAAAQYAPNALFYGVEQRKRLVHHAEKAKESLGIVNAQFIHANFTQLNFNAYDHFYFYNAFYENLIGTDKIDHNIDYSSELYHYYSRYLYRQLDQKPSGTRIVTYHSTEDEIPRDYYVAESLMNNLLKCWIKA